jgi:hypothetical protein
MGQEVGPGFLVDGRVLDRGVGEDQRVRIDQIGLVGGNVGDQVAVDIAVALIQSAALAIGGGCCQRSRDRHGDAGDCAQEQ